MLRRVDRDVGVAGALLLFAILLLVAALRIPTTDSETLGPEVIPLAIGLALAVTAILMAAQGVRRSRKASADSTDGVGVTSAQPSDGSESIEYDEDEPLEADVVPGQGRRFVVLVAMLLGYILIFIPLGYLIATFLFLVGVTTYIDRHKWMRNLVYAAVFTIAVYAAFGLLGVRLPLGILG